MSSIASCVRFAGTAGPPHVTSHVGKQLLEMNEQRHETFPRSSKMNEPESEKQLKLTF
jgi:hypothetical protein